MHCIPKHVLKPFLDKIKSGEITPEKLMDMTSKERHDYFAGFLGDDNASHVNASFESKLLLKNQQQGIVNWAMSATGMKPEVQRDILSRVNKMDKVLTPETQDAFLSDLVAHKLGATVTMEEAGNIATLAKEANRLKKEAETIKSIIDETPEQYEKRAQYGRAAGEFQDYVNLLKDRSKEKTLRQWVMPKNWGEAFVNVAGLSKSLKASFDNSVIGRQGLKTLFTYPDIWAKNSAQSFKDFADVLGGKNVKNEVRADILSRPNALNGLYKKENLAVGVREESYPSSFWEKTPVLGRIFKASETSFSAWQHRTRADVFDRLVDVADKTGADIKGLGKFVNSLTGRGSIGAFEPVSKVLNNVFFSPRFLKANLDTLTAHAFSKDMGSFAKKQAAISTAKVVVGIASVLAIAKALDPDSVELDPRSSDFGKIRIGDTRFDVSGGMSSLVVLAARIIPTLDNKGKLGNFSKNSTSGTLTEINSGKFGSRTVENVIIDFFGGKLAPMAGIFRDISRGKDFNGKPVTVGGELVNLLAPLSASNAVELYNNPNGAPMLAALIADGLGIGTNTYSPTKDWGTSQSKEMAQFKKQVGDAKFKEANDLFNKEANARVKHVTESEVYQGLSDNDKHRVLQHEEKKIKERILRQYHFVYREERKTRLPNIE
jgi:hypothetical protein